MDGLNNLLYLYENVISKNVKNKKKVYYFERFKMMNIYEVYKIIESNRIGYFLYKISRNGDNNGNFNAWNVNSDGNVNNNVNYTNGVRPVALH